MAPRATWALRCTIRLMSCLFLGGLSGCPQPPACPAVPGHLCIRALASPDLVKYYRAEVRVGDTCTKLDDLDRAVTGPTRFQAICPLQTADQNACSKSVAPTPSQNSGMFGCPDGTPAVTAGGVSVCPVPTRSSTEITANIDLSGSSGPGTARMFLFDANGVCLEAGVVSFAASRVQDMSVDLHLTADGCASLWHQPCATDVDCGGPARAQICCNQRCIAPPAPPGGAQAPAPGHRAMTFIPAGTMVMGDPNAVPPGELPCCAMSGQTCGSNPTPTISIGPFYMDVYEADVASYQAFLAQNPGAPAPGSRPSSYLDGSMPQDCTYVAAGTSPAGDPMATQRAVNCVNFAQATSYCSYRPQLDESGLAVPGGLPSEAEWEWVAVGGRVLPLSGKPVVPWSTDPGAPVPTSCQGVWVNFAGISGGMVVSCDAPTAAIPAVRVPGASMGDHTPQLGSAVAWPNPQIWDLAGNLSEWTDTYLVDTGLDATGYNYCSGPNGSGAAYTVVRGGNWGFGSTGLHTYHRDSRSNAALPMDAASLDRVGIRCVLRLKR